MFTDGGSGVTHSGNDTPRMGWAGNTYWPEATSSYYCTGGQPLTGSGTIGTGNTYTFPAIDTFRLWYPRIGTTLATPGNLTYQVDGGSVTTISVASGGSASLAPLYVDILCGSVGTHVLTVNTSSTNRTFIVAVEGYDSTSNQISLLNAGWSSSSTSTWLGSNSQPWSPANFLGSYGQNLTVIALGNNDFNSTGSNIAAFIANMQSLTAIAKAGGSDVAWHTPVPANVSLGISTAVQDQYARAMKVAALASGIPVVDVYGYFGSWVQANANGWITDVHHPNQTGCGIIAQLEYNVLTAP